MLGSPLLTSPRPQPVILPAVLLLSLAACAGSDNGPAAPQAIAQVSVSLPANSAVLHVGEELGLVVTARATDGGAAQVLTVRWSSSDTSVATVSVSGVVRGQSVGSARITANVNGVTGYLDIAVHPPQPARLVIVPASTAMAVGDTLRFGVEAYDAVGGNLPVTSVHWSVSSTDVVRHRDDGLVEALATGNATVRAEVDGVEAVAQVTVRPADARFTSVAVGDRVACARTEAGDVYCWGATELVGRGLGASDVPQSTPMPVDASIPLGPLVGALGYTGGAICALALPPGGRVCWGENTGNNYDASGTHIVGRFGSDARLQSTPIGLSDPVQFVQMALGLEHGCGVSTAGEAYCWGSHLHGQLADSTPEMGQSRPARRVATTQRFTRITSRRYETCAITVTSDLYCWGGGFAVGGSNPEVPRHILSGTAVSEVALGYDHFCVVTAAGAVQCAEVSLRNPPENIATGGPVSSLVSNASNDFCALLSDGTATCWVIALNQSSVPTPVEGGVHFQTLAMGSAICGLATDGLVYCWGGDNRWGEVGDGTTAPRSTPTRVLRQVDP